MKTEEENDKTNTIETTTTPKPNEEKEKKDCDPRTWFFLLCFFFIATIIFPVSGAVVSSDAYEFVNAPQGQCKPKSIKQWDCTTSKGRSGSCSGEASRYVYIIKSDANDSISCREVYKENHCTCDGTPDPEYEGTEWAPCWISDCSGYTFNDPQIKIKTGNILFIMTAPCAVIMITLFCYSFCYIPRQEVKRKQKQKR